MREAPGRPFGRRGELEPQRTLLAEAQSPRARRLAVQAAVAEHLGMVLEQIARAPRPEGLLVRHRRQRQFAVQLGLELAEIEEGEDRRRGAALHVAGAAAEDLVVDQRAAPRILRPAGAVADREHVDVAVEREMATRLAGVEGRNDVGHDLVGRDHAIGYATRIQKLADVRDRLKRVARRIRARAADEVAEEGEQKLAIALDAFEQLFLAVGHARLSPVFDGVPSTRSRIQLSISSTSRSRWEKRPGCANGESSPRCWRSEATMSSSIVMSQRL